MQRQDARRADYGCEGFRRPAGTTSSSPFRDAVSRAAARHMPTCWASVCAMLATARARARVDHPACTHTHHTRTCETPAFCAFLRSPQLPVASEYLRPASGEEMAYTFVFHRLPTVYP